MQVSRKVITAILAICTGLTVSGSASASPQVIASGQLCVADKDHVLHCVNNQHGRERSGNPVIVYHSGHVENNWESVKVGTVSVHPYFPWTGTEGEILDNALRGRPVVELEYLGAGKMGTNYCITQFGYVNSSGHGGIILHECVSSHPRTQLWVHQPEIGWFAVWTTQAAFNEHNFAQLLGIHELDNGLHIGTLQAGAGWTGWNWHPRAAGK